MIVSEYEIRLCQLAQHVTTLIPMETERVRQFVRGLTYPIRQLVFQMSRDGVSFQSMVSATKEVEFVRLGDPKRGPFIRTVLDTSLGGRDMSKGVVHFSPEARFVLH